jgi:hypothetical protein
MAYVDVGEGDPIALLHDNPTSSKSLAQRHSVLARARTLHRPRPHRHGDSDKLPNSGPASYTFVEHRRYLDAPLERLGVRELVTFVIHDWGSALGFDWANPIDRQPADVVEIIRSYRDWLLHSSVLKLFVKGEPGALLASGPPSSSVADGLRTQSPPCAVFTSCKKIRPTRSAGPSPIGFLASPEAHGFE